MNISLTILGGKLLNLGDVSQCPNKGKVSGASSGLLHNEALCKISVVFHVTTAQGEQMEDDPTGGKVKSAPKGPKPYL